MPEESVKQIQQLICQIVTFVIPFWQIIWYVYLIDGKSPDENVFF